MSCLLLSQHCQSTEGNGKLWLQPASLVLSWWLPNFREKRRCCLFAGCPVLVPRSWNKWFSPTSLSLFNQLLWSIIYVFPHFVNIHRQFCNLLPNRQTKAVKQYLRDRRGSNAHCQSPVGNLRFRASSQSSHHCIVTTCNYSITLLKCSCDCYWVFVGF